MTTSLPAVTVPTVTFPMAMVMAATVVIHRRRPDIARGSVNHGRLVVDDGRGFDIDRPWLHIHGSGVDDPG